MKCGPRPLLYYLMRDESPLTASLLKQPWCPPQLCKKPHDGKGKRDPLCDRCPGLRRLRHHD